MAQKQEPRLDNLIDNHDNLDEQLSVVEFIKTLKKAGYGFNSNNSVWKPLETRLLNRNFLFVLLNPVYM